MGIKRYRVVVFDFDSNPESLKITPTDQWDAETIKNHEEFMERYKTFLEHEYGKHYLAQKVENIKDLGGKPFSILAFHNQFNEQIRGAFVMGAYYPALTAACALGERILTHLILTLRDDFKSSGSYKKVYDKDSFDNWDLAISALMEWKVLLPRTEILFREFKEIRNRAIHFRPEVDTHTREIALEAIHKLRDIILEQFGVLGMQPWFIPKSPGEPFFIKAAYENDPFVKKVYLPWCVYVGPGHWIQSPPNAQGIGDMQIWDLFYYQDADISDEEYISLRREMQQKRMRELQAQST